MRTPTTEQPLTVIEQTAGRGAARSAARRRRRSTSFGAERRPRWLTYTILGVVLALSIYPLYYAVLLASSDPITIAQNPIPSLIPQGNLVENLTRVLTADIKFWQAFFNSLAIAVITSLSVVLFATLAGFSFSRLRFRGRGPLLV